MRLVVLDQADFLGGAELFMLDLLNDLSRNNEIFLVSNFNSKYEQRLKKDIKKVRIKIPKLKLFGIFRFLKSLIKIRNFIKNNSADLVISNSVRTGVLCFFLGKKWVHFAHDFTTPKFVSFLLNKANLIFACSNNVKNDLIKKNIKKSKIFVSYNGIKINNNVRIPVDIKKISMIGRLDTWKGQEELLKAILLDVNFYKNFEINFYGESSSHDENTIKYEKKLKEIVRLNNLKNVRFNKFTNLDFVMKNTDLVIHASNKKEPFGRVIIESLANKKPIIVSRLGGGSEIFNEKNEFKKILINPNSENINNTVKFLINNTTKRDKLINLGFELVKKYELKKINNSIIDNIEEVFRTF